jgi:anaerobic magnesium-protoporphyrin IX monomethyl ester cyclase
MYKYNSNHNKKGPVVLVSRPIAFTFPLSYAYLAGFLKQMGEDVRILFREVGVVNEQLVKQLMELNPLLVGFGNLYPELQDIKELIKALDDAGRSFPIVVGGQMVSPIPEFAVNITGADFGVIGEGEIILYELVKALREGLDPSTVKGLAIRQGDEVHLTGPGEFIEDLSQLPPIPYEHFPEKDWLNIGRWYTENRPTPHWRFADRVVNVHGARGCPYKCNFCYHHSKTRYRPISHMMAEAEAALARFNGNMLYFSDDLVISTPKRANQLIEAIKALKKPIQYSISSRIDILDRMSDDVLAAMKETGCRIMGLGIESGSDRILKVIGKTFTADMVLTQLERLKRVGILPTVSIMVGQHTETKEDVMLSIELMKESVRNDRNIQYAFTVTTPFPGSKLYKMIFDKGYLKDDQEFYSIYFSSPGEWKQIVNLSEMSDAEVSEMYQKLCQAYEVEKAKFSGSRVIQKIESSQKRLCQAENYMDSNLARYLPINQRRYDSVFESLQTKLDKLRLKCRGIS